MSGLYLFRINQQAECQAQMLAAATVKPVLERTYYSAMTSGLKWPLAMTRGEDGTNVQYVV